MRAGLALALALAACGPTRYLTITNGGVALPRGDCSDVVVTRRDEALAIALPGEPGCSGGDRVAVGATGVYWQVAGSSWAGPRPSNPASVALPVLTSGESQKALTSGESQKALISGEQQRGLISGEGQKALISGEQQRGLTSGEGQKALTSGEAQKALVSGEQQRGLTAGEQQRGLTSGEQQRGLTSGENARGLSAGFAERPVVEIVKSASGDVVTPEKPVRFLIRVTNVGAAPLTRLFIFDRLPPALFVDATNARVLPAPDGSQVLAWELAEPLAPRRTATVEVTVRAKSAR